MINQNQLITDYFVYLAKYYDEYRWFTIMDVEKLLYIEVKIEQVVTKYLKFEDYNKLSLFKAYKEVYEIFKDDLIALNNNRYFEYEVFDFFKSAIERSFFKQRVLNTKNNNIYVLRLKEIHFPILLKYNKKVEFKYADDDISLAAKELGLLKVNDFNLDSSPFKFYNFNNTEILNLDLLFDFNIIKPIHNTLSEIINNDNEYKMIYMPKTINRFMANRLSKLLDNVSFIKGSTDDKTEVPLVFNDKTLLALNESYQNNLLNIYKKDYRFSVCIEINSVVSFYKFVEKGFKLLIINIDEISNNDLSLNNYKNKVVNELRLIRDVARTQEIRIIIKSNQIWDKVVIDKIFILGFKEYIYQGEVFNKVKEVLNKFVARRQNPKIINKKVKKVGKNLQNGFS